MERIEEYIRKAKSLPPAPKILPQLMPLLKQTDIDIDRVVQIISFDAVLTAKILKACNSASQAGLQQVSNLNEALLRTGFAEVFRIVAKVVGEQTLGSSQSGYGLGRSELWEHSAVTAVAARIVAEDRGLDPNVAFTAGLLHDVGKIVLTNALEGSYTRLVEETEKNQLSLIEAEKSVLGADHAEVGGRLLSEWCFPKPLVDAVAWHHDPAQSKENAPLAACIYLANMIAAFTGHSFGFQSFALRGRGEALQILNLHGDELPMYMIKTVDEISKVALLAAA